MHFEDDDGRKPIKILRPGKTRRDHKSGVWTNRFTNQQARDAWLKGEEKHFPTHACNGHRYYRGGSNTTTERLKRRAL